MKYPKEWVDVLKDMKVSRKGPFVTSEGEPNPYHDDTEYAPKFILDRLNTIGALKTPPQPREFWICKIHDSFGEIGAGRCYVDIHKDIQVRLCEALGRFREVESEND